MITRDTKTIIVSRCLEVLATLQPLKNRLPRAQATAHSISLGLESDRNILLNSLAQELRNSEPFQNLISYLFDDDLLFTIFTGIKVDPETRTDELSLSVFRVYLEIIMLRVLFRGDIVKTISKEEPEAFLERFTSFLAEPIVERDIRVPLFHLDLGEESYDLGDFGTLRKIKTAKVNPFPSYFAETDESSARCELILSIKTGPFSRATDFPITNLLKSRVGLLRLAIYPLISYNHFYVQHADPWELRIEDTQYFGRQWTPLTSQDLGLKRHIVGERDIEQFNNLYESYSRMDWERLTPWRLSMDRLDDAIFKIECLSPDAILDIVIGFESIFIEADSRQESTHKVAIRVARYLEELLPARSELFRKMKQIYRSRSTLAHGQHWDLKAENIPQVVDAAQLLARTLRKMAQSNCSNINHHDLELS